jgi:hypothetical protein
VSVSFNVTIIIFLDCKYSSFGAGIYSERQRYYLTLGIMNMGSRLCHRKNEHAPCIVVCGTAHWILYYVYSVTVR